MGWDPPGNQASKVPSGGQQKTPKKRGKGVRVPRRNLNSMGPRDQGLGQDRESQSQNETQGTRKKKDHGFCDGILPGKS